MGKFKGRDLTEKEFELFKNLELKKFEKEFPDYFWLISNPEEREELGRIIEMEESLSTKAEAWRTGKHIRVIQQLRKDKREEALELHKQWIDRWNQWWRSHSRRFIEYVIKMGCLKLTEEEIQGFVEYNTQILRDKGIIEV